MRELRERTGLSQEALGHRLGVSFRTIAEWENQRSIPRVDRAVELASVFGVSLKDVAASIGLEVSRVLDDDLSLDPKEGERDIEIDTAIDESEIPRAITMAVLAKRLRISLKKLYSVYGIDIADIPDDLPELQQPVPLASPSDPPKELEQSSPPSDRPQLEQPAPPEVKTKI